MIPTSPFCVIQKQGKFIVQMMRHRKAVSYLCLATKWPKTAAPIPVYHHLLLHATFRGLAFLSCCTLLVSRSRALRCAAELERVLSSMEATATTEAARVIGISELAKAGVAKRTANLVNHVIANCRGLEHLRSEMLDILCSGTCVTFFSAAGNDLLVAISRPHDVLEVAGVKRVRTLWMESYKKFEVYKVENGVDMIKNADYTALTEFIVDALIAREIQVAPPMSPHSILRASNISNDRTLLVETRKRYVVASSSDWGALSRSNDDATLFDLQLPQTWNTNSKVAVLIDGESGSGKTLEMICGHCDKSDLVIYIRLCATTVANNYFYSKYGETINQNDIIVQSIASNSAGFSLEDLKELNNARLRRNDAFISLAAAAVKAAVDDSCLTMDSNVLTRLSSSTFTVVRLCFDDMGGSPALVRACCAMDTTKLRESLNWGPLVYIYVVAGGTGIGKIDNAGAMERTMYQLSVLSNQAATTRASVYWKYRIYMLQWAESCDHRIRLDANELLSDTKMLQKHWGDSSQRDALLRKREMTLSRLFKAQAEYLAGREKWKTLVMNTPLIEESLFAAVESDAACAAALANPRMAALIVREVQKIARWTDNENISAAASRRDVCTVLQRTTLLFKRRSALNESDTPAKVSAQLVEALRYVLFDGYANADTHNAGLASFGGIIVDSATFESVVPKGCAVVLGDDNKPRTMTIKSSDSEPGVVYTACYPKDVGRYSISPAMVVVLTTLMTGAFEENFSNISGGFEHSVAKFLYLAVQAFHGRPVRELVDFIVGPSAVVGEAAEKILDSSTTIDFRSLTLRKGVQRKTDAGECSGAPQTPGATQLTVEGLRRVTTNTKQADGADGLCAWIEIVPVCQQGSAVVVLHIPNAITIPFFFGESIEQEAIGFGGTISTFVGHPFLKCPPSALEGSSPAVSVKACSERLHRLCAPVIPVLYASRRSCVNGCDNVRAVADGIILVYQGILDEDPASPNELQVTSMLNEPILGRTKHESDRRLCRLKAAMMHYAEVGERSRTVDLAETSATSSPHTSGVYHGRSYS